MSTTEWVTDDVVEQGGDIICDVLDSHGHNGVDCRPDAGFDLHCAEAFRASLSAVLPGIIQQAKAEAREAILGQVPKIIRHSADSPEFWEGYIGAVKAEALRDAADELRRLDDGRTGGYYEAGRHIIRRLDARADQMEAGR